MTTKLEIVNSALLRCGAEPLTAIPDLTNKRGNLINNHYDIVLREILNDTPWNFAKKRLAVTVDGTPPLYGYNYRYQLPSDCIRVLGINDEDDQIPFSIEAGYLLCNLDTSINIRYISYVTDTTIYSASFVTAFYLKLAENISYSLVQSQSLQQAIISEAERYLRKARSYNSQEGFTGVSPYNEAYTTGRRL